MRKKTSTWRSVYVLCFLETIAQRTISGKVTDVNNKPVFNASVTVKGSNIGTNTDNDGNFTIVLPKGRNTLSVSSIGFETQDINATGNNVNVTLSTRTTTLNDVVVVGYSSQRKKDITGAVSVVNVKDLKQIPSGTTEALLQGQAAGVTVINSGTPGGGSNLRIRGVTSIGNSDPLVIIDGVQGSMHDLDVNDIESIQVLKDAGAAAIYGVRGSNGVVVITTKRGRSGKSRVTYDGFVGTQRPLKTGFDIANTQNTGEAIAGNFLMIA